MVFLFIVRICLKRNDHLLGLLRQEVVFEIFEDTNVGCLLLRLDMIRR